MALVEIGCTITVILQCPLCPWETLVMNVLHPRELPALKRGWKAQCGHEPLAAYDLEGRIYYALVAVDGTEEALDWDSAVILPDRFYRFDTGLTWASFI